MITKTEKPDKIGKFGVENGMLLDGERIDTVLNLSENGERGRSGRTVFLTDQRVIYLDNERGSSTIFVSLCDVEAVEVANQGRGLGGYVWGALSLAVSVILWQAWDSPTWSPLAGIAVALIGVYLLIDHVLMPEDINIKMRVGSTNVECGVTSKANAENLREFINRLFQRKNREAARGGNRPFASR